MFEKVLQRIGNVVCEAPPSNKGVGIWTKGNWYRINADGDLEVVNAYWKERLDSVLESPAVESRKRIMEIDALGVIRDPLHRIKT